VEIVSKVILRHANFSSQRYLGKVSDLEAIRWIDNMGWGTSTDLLIWLIMIIRFPPTPRVPAPPHSNFQDLCFLDSDTTKRNQYIIKYN
jgi:hypothetical protein